jgi:hypothetical protein
LRRGQGLAFLAQVSLIIYYFDGENRPRIDRSFPEFFGKNNKFTTPFAPPLAYFDLDAP